jgi:hypothetical protein
MHVGRKRTVPELRWAGVVEARHEVVAVTEARCVPSRTWCRDHLPAHARAPDAPVVGGIVAPALPAAPAETGLYFCEYGRFARAPIEPRVTELSLANLAYKRSDLLAEADLLARGVWDTAIHERWLSRGRPLYLCAATVVFENSMDVPTMLRQRFQYGRGYAAQRTHDAPAIRRLAFAAGSVVLPALLTWRVGRSAEGTIDSGGAPASLPALFLRSFAWVIAFHTAWAMGELAGYVAGPPGDPQIF